MKERIEKTDSNLKVITNDVIITDNDMNQGCQYIEKSTKYNKQNIKQPLVGKEKGGGRMVTSFSNRVSFK